MNKYLVSVTAFLSLVAVSMVLPNQATAQGTPFLSTTSTFSSDGSLSVTAKCLVPGNIRYFVDRGPANLTRSDFLSGTDAGQCISSLTFNVGKLSPGNHIVRVLGVFTTAGGLMSTWASTITATVPAVPVVDSSYVSVSVSNGGKFTPDQPVSVTVGCPVIGAAITYSVDSGPTTSAGQCTPSTPVTINLGTLSSGIHSIPLHWAFTNGEKHDGITAATVAALSVTNSPLSFQQDSMGMYYEPGKSSASDTAKSDIITNPSDGVVSFTVSVPNRPSWLTDVSRSFKPGYSFESGVPDTIFPRATKILWAVADASGLAPGNYTADIILTGNFSQSPKTIAVNLTVGGSSAAAPQTAAQPDASSSSTKFNSNDRVQTSGALNVRTLASASASLIETRPAGSVGVVVGGPSTAGGYTWWQIEWDNGTTGWSVDNYLSLASVSVPQSANASSQAQTTPAATSAKFAANARVQTTGVLNVRTGALISASLIDVMQPGSLGVVVGGPSTAGGYTWWQITWDNGTTGWSVENYLVASSVSVPQNANQTISDTTQSQTTTNTPQQPQTTTVAPQTQATTNTPPQSLTTAPTATPTFAKFAANARVQTTGVLNARNNAKATATLVDVLQPGSLGVVAGAATIADGYTWWKVQWDNGSIGWSVENYLIASSVPAPQNTNQTTTDATQSQTTTNTSTTNTPQQPQTTTVAPQTQTTTNTPQQPLTTTPAVTPATLKFTANGRVQTTNSLNVRTSAQASATLTDVLQPGSLGSIVGSATIADGYTWWKVQWDNGSIGWSVENYLVASSAPAPQTTRQVTVDTSAPSVPTGLVKGGFDSTNNYLTLSWTASTDNVAVTGYKVYMDGTFVQSTAQTSMSGISVGPVGSTHTFTVQAYDAAGNVSAQSAVFSYNPTVTVAAVDAVAPSAPTGLARASFDSVNSYLTLSWNASTDNVAVTGYKVYAGGTYLQSTAQTSMPGISVAPAGSVHTYTVQAYDAAGNVSAQSAVFSYTTPSSTVLDTTAPSVPTDVHLTKTNVDPADLWYTINWSASTDNVAVTGYKVYVDGTYLQSTAQISMPGFYGGPVGSTHTFSVQAYDAAGNISAQSAVFSFTTPVSSVVDTAAPSVPTGLAKLSFDPSNNYLTLSWTASTDSIGVTGYKVYMDGTYVQSTAQTNMPGFYVGPTGSTHTFSVQAYDAAGNTSAQSAVFSYTTPVNTDLTAPSVPTGLAVISFDPAINMLLLSWTASTDNVAVTGYKVYKDGALVQMTSQTSLGGLAVGPVGSTHTFTVQAYDAAGNISSQSAVFSYTTPVPSPAADTTAPSVPLGLAKSSFDATNNLLTLSWTASVDSVGVAGYKVYKDGSFVQLSSQTSMANLAVGPVGSTHTFTVQAYDAAGNISAQSAVFSYTTPVPLDTTAPSVPTGLARTSFDATNNLLTLSWTTSTDNVAVTGYKVYKDGALVQSTTQTSLGSLSVGPVGSTHTFTVQAYDAVGNVSAQSAVFSYTTPAPAPAVDSTAPSAPTGLAKSSFDATSLYMTLSWTAATDNVAVTGYKVYMDGTYVQSTAQTNMLGFYVGPTGSTHTFSVQAYDAAGNISGQSAVFSYTTPSPAVTDTTAPSVPTGISVSSYDSVNKYLTLSWNASTDNGTGALTYNVFMDGFFIQSTSQVYMAGFYVGPNGSNHTFTIQASDAAGNVSAQSAVFSYRTPTPTSATDPYPPSVPTGLRLAKTNPDPADFWYTIYWNASTDNVAVTGYNVYLNGSFVQSTAQIYMPGFYAGPVGSVNTFSVQAFDEAGNVSANSAPYTLTTPISLGKNTSYIASALGGLEGLTANNVKSEQQQTGFRYVWNHDLQIGSTYTADISALQNALTLQGLYSGEITGGFYTQTYLAVKAFQLQHNIEATGFVGPLTRTQLNALYK